MKLPARFNPGDIIQRLPTRDPYDTYNKDINKYGILTFLVMDVEYRHIYSVQKTIILYKIFCMQTEEITYVSMREKNGWKKIG